jgi:hypothetical protein
VRLKGNEKEEKKEWKNMSDRKSDEIERKNEKQRNRRT